MCSPSTALAALSPNESAYNSVWDYQKLAGMLPGYRQLLKAIGRKGHLVMRP